MAFAVSTKRQRRRARTLGLDERIERRALVEKERRVREEMNRLREEADRGNRGALEELLRKTRCPACRASLRAQLEEIGVTEWSEG